jgi:hypothetical protein
MNRLQVQPVVGRRGGVALASLAVVSLVAVFFAPAARASQSSAAGAERRPGAVRVFAPGLRTTVVDPAVADGLMTRVVVAARSHQARFTVYSVSDLRAVVELEAERQATGCDTDSCASEIAAALDAPQLLVASLDRVGDRWSLTLTRTERVTLRVLVQRSRDVLGATPGALLDVIPGLVDEVLGPPPPSPLVAGGAIAAGVGVAAVAVGFVPLVAAWAAQEEAEDSLANDQTADAQDAVDRGRGALLGAQGLWIGGAIVGVVGAAVSVAGLLQGDAE